MPTDQEIHVENIRKRALYRTEKSVWQYDDRPGRKQEVDFEFTVQRIQEFWREVLIREHHIIFVGTYHTVSHDDDGSYRTLVLTQRFEQIEKDALKHPDVPPEIVSGQWMEDERLSQIKDTRWVIPLSEDKGKCRIIRFGEWKDGLYSDTFMDTYTKDTLIPIITARSAILRRYNDLVRTVYAARVALEGMATMSVVDGSGLFDRADAEKMRMEDEIKSYTAGLDAVNKILLGRTTNGVPPSVPTLLSSLKELLVENART